MTCEARIRPLRNDIELRCELEHKFQPEPSTFVRHQAVLRDYAYPGSTNTITWLEGDRSNFRGEWAPCPFPNCIFPKGHARGHGA